MCRYRGFSTGQYYHQWQYTRSSINILWHWCHCVTFQPRWPQSPLYAIFTRWSVISPETWNTQRVQSPQKQLCPTMSLDSHSESRDYLSDVTQRLLFSDHHGQFKDVLYRLSDWNSYQQVLGYQFLHSCLSFQLDLVGRQNPINSVKKT